MCSVLQARSNSRPHDKQAEWAPEGCFPALALAGGGTLPADPRGFDWGGMVGTRAANDYTAIKEVIMFTKRN